MSDTLRHDDEWPIVKWIFVGLSAASRMDRVAMGILRAALVIVLFWLGGLKFVGYEAESSSWVSPLDRTLSIPA